MSIPILLCLGGCASGDRPALGTVSGTITLDGKPLPGAGIGFTPLDGGRQSSAVADSRGRYELIYLRDIKGAKIGKHLVRITTADSEAGKSETLPPRYHVQSDLERTVEPGSNQIDFALTTP